MRSKRQFLLIAVAVLLVLTGLMTWLLLSSPKEQLASSTGSTDTSLMILQTDQDVTSIDISNPSGSYSILPADDTTEEDPKWKIDSLQDAPQYQSKYNDLMEVMKELEAVQKLENLQELSVYGLDQPTKGTAHYADGTTKTILVGNAAPGGLNYYCKLEDQDDIYLVSGTTAEKFLRSTLDYVDLSLTSTVETTTYTTSSSDDTSSSTTSSTLNISNITIQRKDLASPVVFTNQDNQLVQNGEPVDDVLSSQLESAISSITASSTVAVSPTSAQRSEYGFDDPKATVSYTVSGTTYSFTIGNGLTEAELPEQETDEDSHSSSSTSSSSITPIKAYYVMMEGRDVVYIVSKDSLPWLTMDLQ